MKFTAVNESLSKQSRNDLFQSKINMINIILMFTMLKISLSRGHRNGDSVIIVSITN